MVVKVSFFAIFLILQQHEEIKEGQKFSPHFFEYQNIFLISRVGPIMVKKLEE